MGKTCDKIKKFIEDDRPQKLKSYLIEHRIGIDDYTFNKGQNLLHYSVKKSSPGVLGYLLRMDFDVRKKNSKGQTALDIAIRKSKKSKRSTAIKIYQEIVVPLVDYYQHDDRHFKLPTKIKMKLKELQEKLFHQHEQNSSPHVKVDNSRLSSTSESETDEDMEDEKRWNEKIQEENDDEYMSLWGNYEEDFCDEGEKETYDQWTSRIHREHKLKQQANRFHPYNYTSPKSTNGTSSKTDTILDDKKSKQKIREENLRQKRIELEKIFAEKQLRIREISRQEKKYKYEEKYTKFIQTKGQGQIKYNDIPWPFRTKLSEITDILFCDFNDKNSDSYRKYLREQQVRWHPDKFRQNFVEYLAEGEKEEILDRVTEISQFLNKLSEK
ncbi:hypothetical protein SNE40_000086 [Patella caerulea]|uniref:NF-kappa-B inhibitor-like protein 1 n=1 Tax=Patella caerulea TaxID=87958 RepID=A0AAN8K9T4_PATCE